MVASSPRLVQLSTCALLASLTLACNQSPSTSESTATSTTETSTTGDGDSDPLAPTYWQDVAPIYFESCVTCHNDAGIAPFSLDTYESASTLAPLCVEAVSARTMPPWLVVDDGTCNQWQDSTALTDAQIDTITAWLDAGTPEGEPRDDLSPPEPSTLDGGHEVATPDFSPEPEGGLLTMSDEYRCFVLDPNIEQDGFVTASAVTPGNPALVHHVLGLIVDPDRVNDEGMTNLEAIEALDAESPDRLGWPCLTVFGDGFEPKGIPIVWAPGQGVSELPAGTGMAVEAGDLVVTQIHYNLEDTSLIGQSDSTTLGLRVEDTVEREGIFNVHLGLIQTFFGGDPHTLPPGEEAYEYTYTIPMDGYVNRFGGDTAELWGYFPHAHERGVSMSARLLDANDEQRCLAEVPRWDYNWQLYYFMQQPLILRPGDKLEMTCTYDTSDDSQPIIPGWGTQNEMCFMGLYISAPS